MTMRNHSIIENGQQYALLLGATMNDESQFNHTNVHSNNNKKP